MDDHSEGRAEEAERLLNAAMRARNAQQAINDLGAGPPPTIDDLPWEYVPGHLYVIDGETKAFVQSGVIADGYVEEYYQDGGEVLRRKVGPWEVFNGTR